MIMEKAEKTHQINGVKIGYSEKQITSYGGLSMIAMYFEKIQLKEAVRQMLPITEVSPNAMKAEEKIFGFMTLLLAGASRFSHMIYVGNPGSLKSLFGLKRLPLAGTTLARYFKKITTIGQANTLSENVWRYVKKVVKWDQVEADWLSFDSTVITRYGEQEGAKKGYNPNKKGRASHHPILAFLNGCRLVINIWNRSGNTSSSHNIISFFEDAYRRVVDVIKLKGVLADSGFYDEIFIKAIESKNLPFIITAKLYSTLQKRIYEHKSWQYIEKGLWVSEFNFQHLKWEKSYRYVIVRQSIQTRKNPLGKQLRLFEIETESYRYGVWITNLKCEPLEVWRTIRLRSNDENTIKEFKEDLALCGFSMTSFFATEAAFVIRVLLYNLLLVFRRSFLPEKDRMIRISTLRFKYFVIPAHLGRNAEGRWLKLAVFPQKLKTKIQTILDDIQAYSRPNFQLQCSCL